MTALQPQLAPDHAIRVRRPWQRTVLSFLVAFGPGLIVMEADNDAGAVSTYMQAGGQYGLHLLWVLVLLLPICYFVQEMVARLGIATGKGHAAMIYERFGKAWGRFSLFDLLAVNFLTLITEFAAISLAMSGLGVAPMLSVPLAAIALVGLIASGSYRRWERIVVILCLLDLTWFVAAALLHPNWSAALTNTFIPSLPHTGHTGDLVFLIIAIVGTTIAPWQLFFQQSCVAEKRLRFADLKWARLDTLIGAVFSILVAGAMMLTGAFAYNHHIPFTDPAQLAQSIATVLPHRSGSLPPPRHPSPDGQRRRPRHHRHLARQRLGLRRGRRLGALPPQKALGSSRLLRRLRACVFAAAGIVLLPHLPLQLVIVSVQVFAGLILPSAIIFLQLLLNDRALLGDRWVNRPWNNWINWSIVAVLFALSLILAAQILLPNLFT